MSLTKPNLRVLIVRLSAIGDVLHGLPVLNALRTALPSAFIVWAVEGRAADLVRGHRALNDTIPLQRGWLKSPSAIMALRRRLKGLRFDVAIDLQGLTKSAVAARLSGAPVRIGFGGPDGRELSTWLNNRRVVPTQTHVIDRNLELLAPLGITNCEVQFNLEDSPTDEWVARNTIEKLQLGERFALINPGAGWPSKVWPAERHASVARHLGSRHGLRSLVVWAGDQELKWAEQIVYGSAGFATLAPATTLRELAAVARRATLMVASDTGPLHLAAAVGTPCVGLFGPMPGERNGPYGPQHVIVQKMCLNGTSRERRSAGPESMAAISVDEVAAACDSILQAGLARRSA